MWQMHTAMLLASYLIIAAVLFAVESQYFKPQEEDEYGATRRGCNYQLRYCSDSDKYRSYDGICNNKQIPFAGSVNIPHRRLLPEDYSDGVSKPRLAKSGRPLPSARAVTNALKDLSNKTSSKVSHFHVLWGQLLMHDIVLTPVERNRDNSEIKCDCSNPHPSCMNIAVPGNDQQRKFGRRCLPFVRSKTATGRTCKFQRKQQINEITCYIDGSMIYGSSKRDADNLREPYTAGLKMGPFIGNDKHPLLPTQNMIRRPTSNNTECPVEIHKPRFTPCFVTGDIRSNENPMLTSLHTLWVRYHNVIANRLRAINPYWQRERLFQTTRKIVIAVIQKITYDEYLPLLLGPIWVKKFSLQLLKDGYWYGYTPDYDPAMINSMATAGLRYGHSQLVSPITRPSPNFINRKRYNLLTQDSFFNNEPLYGTYSNGIGSIIRGLMSTNAFKIDMGIVEDLRNHLFQEFNDKHGEDLYARNIQRGRDHGLPGYNTYRTLNGDTISSTFNDLVPGIAYKDVERLKAIYDSVDDIDLFVGGLAEKHIEQGIIGPTFACILGYMFRSLRRGDRFWFENNQKDTGFSLPQLSSIREMTLAHVICDTTNDMVSVLSKPMMAPGSQYNKKLDCYRLSKINLAPFSDSYVAYPQGPPTVVTEWSAWFVTSVKSQALLNISPVLARVKEYRPKEVCEEIVNYQIRSVFKDPYLQIRFSCLPGTIHVSDYPADISPNYYFTEWKIATSLEKNDGYAAPVHRYGCTKPAFLQAQTINGISAGLSGDVFEEYSLKTGFLCRDRQQLTGYCQQYKVRLLCHVEKAAKKPEPIPKPTVSHIPPYVTKNALNFCSAYGYCCSGGLPFGGSYRYIPARDMNKIRSYCGIYNICCK